MQEERTVDLNFLKMPLWEQVYTFGHKWIAEQQKIFDEVYQGGRGDE